ncbi:peptidylprolyl isomerase [Gammaproteobacteria bacterium]|nr:peptidylprolyl isomerase [Gammaproteobacteria bacterium]
MKTNFVLKSLAVALLATQLNFALAQAPATTTVPAVTLLLPEVIAKIGDRDVTLAEYNTLIRFMELRGQASPQNADQVKQLVESYIQQMAILASAQASGIEKDADFILQKQFAVNDLIINAYVAKTRKEIVVTDEEIKAAYDTEAARLKALPAVKKTEYKLTHILVKTKAEADKIIKEINDKKISFANAARRADPEKGGDLGWLQAETTLPGLIQGLEKLKGVKGFSKTPIQSEVGFHIVNLQDSRIPTILPLDQIKDPIRASLINQKLQNILQEQEKALNIKNLIP